MFVLLPVSVGVESSEDPAAVDVDDEPGSEASDVRGYRTSGVGEQQTLTGPALL